MEFLPQSLESKQFNLRRSFIILLSIICITLNVAGVVVYRQYNQVASSSAWVEHTYRVISIVQGFYGNIEKMIAVQRGYLMTGNLEYFTRYADASHELESQLQEARKHTADNPAQLERFERLAVVVKELRLVLESKADIQRRSPGLAPIDIREDVETVKKLADEVRDLTAMMLATEKTLLQQRTQDEKDKETSYFYTLAFTSLVTLAIVLGGNAMIFTLTARQRRIERDLATVSERLELALRGTNDGVFDWFVDSPDIFLSRRFREMLGYTDEELPGTLEAFNRILHPDDRELAWAYIRQYLNREIDEYRNLFRIQHRDGTWRWHLARGAALFSAEGKAVRLIGAHTDVTEQKTLEDRLRASNKELEEFTYIASHDLRSPLVNLKGFAGEIERALRLSAPYVDEAVKAAPEEKRAEIRDALRLDLPQALHFIKSSVTRMDKLTQSILELSRLGRRVLRFEKVDVRALVENCLKTLQHQIADKHISVELGDLPPVVADSMAMEQVFGNIIDNAVKYMVPGRAGRIEISGRAGASETVFTLKDNGRGIAADDLKKVFEIFKRAGDNSHIPGEGMGMPYVQATIRRHGGVIWCNSEEGAGTTFYFTIPHHIKKEANHG